MITGVHSIIYSKNADLDRAFFQDILALPSVDVGGGWLIFGLPPAEVAVHPANNGGAQELYLMTDDISRFIAAMKERDIACSEPSDQGWGVLMEVTLPGGGKLGVYEPRHERPEPPGPRKRTPRPRATAKRAPARASKGKAKGKGKGKAKIKAKSRGKAKPPAKPKRKARSKR